MSSIVKTDVLMNDFDDRDVDEVPCFVDVCCVNVMHSDRFVSWVIVPVSCVSGVFVDDRERLSREFALYGLIH